VQRAAGTAVQGSLVRERLLPWVDAPEGEQELLSLATLALLYPEGQTAIPSHLEVAVDQRRRPAPQRAQQG